MITTETAERAIRAVLEIADYDLWKHFNPDTSEDPEEAQCTMDPCVPTSTAGANEVVQEK